MAATESETNGAATTGRGRSTVLGRVDAFLAQRDNLSRDEIREWMPELREHFAVLLEMYSRQNPHGIHSRCDPAIAQRLNGLLALFTKAETIGVKTEEGDLRDYALYDE